MHAIIQVGKVVVQNPVVRQAATKFVVAVAGAAGAVIGKAVGDKVVKKI